VHKELRLELCAWVLVNQMSNETRLRELPYTKPESAMLSDALDAFTVMEQFRIANKNTGVTLGQLKTSKNHFVTFQRHPSTCELSYFALVLRSTT